MRNPESSSGQAVETQSRRPELVEGAGLPQGMLMAG
jgi:hypothetical protein